MSDNPWIIREIRPDSARPVRVRVYPTEAARLKALIARYGQAAGCAVELVDPHKPATYGALPMGEELGKPDAA